MRYLALILVLFAVAFAACQSAATVDSTAVKSVSTAEIKQISVQEASEAVKAANVQFVDVRTPEEYKSGHAPKALNMPLDGFEKELAKLDKDKPVYLICQTGRRSQKAAEMLQSSDFKTIYNITGGTSAWTTANLPLEK